MTSPDIKLSALLAPIFHEHQTDPSQVTAVQQVLRDNPEFAQQVLDAVNQSNSSQKPILLELINKIFTQTANPLIPTILKQNLIGLEYRHNQRIAHLQSQSNVIQQLTAAIGPLTDTHPDDTLYKDACTAIYNLYRSVK